MIDLAPTVSEAAGPSTCLRAEWPKLFQGVPSTCFPPAFNGALPFWRARDSCGAFL